MKKTGKIVSNDNLVRDIHKMTFDMGECDFRLPGQYAMIEAGGVRRPYQVCDFDSNRFTVVFPADGKESKILASLSPGEDVTVTMGLGNGFDLDAMPDEVLLVADDLGIPEMLGLSRARRPRPRQREDQTYRRCAGYTRASVLSQERGDLQR